MMNTTIRIWTILLFICHIVQTYSHKCGFDHIHEEIQANHPNTPRKISNLTYQHFIPDLLSSNTYKHKHHQRKLIDSNYHQIRIVPYWGYLDEILKDRPTDLQFIKELVSASIRYISQFVYTIPVQNNLTIPHLCEQWNQYGCQQFVDYREFGLFSIYVSTKYKNESKYRMFFSSKTN